MTRIVRRAGVVLEVLVGLTIHAVGQVSKRGLIPRLPAPEKVLGDVQAWLATEHPDVVRSMRCDRNAAGDTELLLDLHPAADPVTITVSDVGRVVASADTSAVGPGYHTFVGRTLERAGDTQGIDWTGETSASAPRPGGTGGATPDATAALRDRPSVERAHLAWLGRLLVRAREARHAGVTGLHLGRKPASCIASTGPSRRRSGRVTTPGSSRHRLTRGSRSICGRGGPTRPTVGICSTAPCASCGPRSAGARRAATRSGA